MAVGNEERGQLIRLASDIVIAYVRNNPVPATELSGVIKTVHSALGSFAGSDRS